MENGQASYQRKKQNLCTYLDRAIYQVMAEEPERKWDLSEIQDRIESDWGIRPYRATLLRHASDFYSDHHMPLFYKTSFSEDKYRLNTSIAAEKWQEFFKPKPKGRPRKYNITSDVDI